MPTNNNTSDMIHVKSSLYVRWKTKAIHGYSRYVNHRCRCWSCTDASRQYHLKYRMNRRDPARLHFLADCAQLEKTIDRIWPDRSSRVTT